MIGAGEAWIVGVHGSCENASETQRSGRAFDARFAVRKGK